MSEALADPDAYSRLMPDTADLKARFGADVMAAEIEKAYFAALRAVDPKGQLKPQTSSKPSVVSRVS